MLFDEQKCVVSTFQKPPPTQDQDSIEPIRALQS